MRRTRRLAGNRSRRKVHLVHLLSRPEEDMEREAMTRDDLIQMAGDAGFEVDTDDVWITDGYWLKELTRFAAFVAAAEREACAQVCEGFYDTAQAARAIRARGEK
jgi:hypothetical protein